MNGGPACYVLDANVFMEAARRYYAFDIAPSFWQALIQHAQAGKVLSIDRVKNEINRGKDVLKKWASNYFNSWFNATNGGAVINAYGLIIQWAYSQTQFTDAAKAEFASEDNADAWVVAYAKAKNCIVVTHEEFKPGIQRRIPISNVCRAFGIPYVDTFEMIRALGVTIG